MKKTIILFAIVVLAFNMCSCTQQNKEPEEKKPLEYSDNAMTFTKGIVLYTQRYLDGITSINETNESLRYLLSNFHIEKNNEYYDNDLSLYSKAQLLVKYMCDEEERKCYLAYIKDLYEDLYFEMYYNID